MPEPIKANRQEATRIGLRTWNTSEAEAIKGPRTAWTRLMALTIQVCAAGLPRSAPIRDSFAPLAILFPQDGSSTQLQSPRSTYHGRRPLECNALAAKYETDRGQRNPSAEMQFWFFFIISIDEITECVGMGVLHLEWFEMNTLLVGFMMLSHNDGFFRLHCHGVGLTLGVRHFVVYSVEWKAEQGEKREEKDRKASR